MNRKGPIILVCTGLGRVQRGFEMYIESLAKKLSAEQALIAPIEVWTGGDWTAAGIKTRKIASVDRGSRWLKNNGSAFTWEQRSFAAGMLTHIIRTKPTAIYLGEYRLYCYLYKIRKLLQLNFSLILYTGGQAMPGLFDPQLDFVHHVTDVYLDSCRHIPASRQFVLPHFIEEDFVYQEQRQEQIKQQAGGKQIVLSVGLVDKTIKRMDYLVQSLAPLSDIIFPVLLGENANDTAEIKALLDTHFGNGNYIMDKVEHPRLGDWYKAADAFVLCSPKESFGLSFVEALYHGLPVICDDFAEARYVLKEQGYFVRMKEQALTEAVRQVLGSKKSYEANQAFAKNHYTWGALKKDYMAMFNAFTQYEHLLERKHDQVVS